MALKDDDIRHADYDNLQTPPNVALVPSVPVFDQNPQKAPQILAFLPALASLIPVSIAEKL
ncbi:MAG: hypothetical protein RLZZ444_3672, partial [Pseudomonadota bacterium]